MYSDKRDQENLFPPRVPAPPASRQSGMGQPYVTIDMLHDDVLLEVFDSYRRLVSLHGRMWKWQTFLHVCRRWRYIVLASPRRLDLRIACDRRTPTRELLDVWPPFPISLSCYPSSGEGTWGNHNIFAALKRRNRIAHIDFSDITCLEVEHFAAAMDEPFPILTDLRVSTLAPEIDQDLESAVTPELPDSFLGGSAPRLQSFFLEGIAFPALPNFVLSPSHLQCLHLLEISHAGYIPPETMVLFLLPLHNLKSLAIGFTSPESRPFQMSPPTSTHALLPSLTEFQFDGAGEYLVDFIARIDTPMLNSFRMMLTLESIPNVSQFHQFIDHTDRFKTFIQAEVCLRPWEVQAIFKSPANPGLKIACEVVDWPLPSMMALFGRLLPIPSAVEQLKLYEAWDEPDFSIEEERQDDLDDLRSLEFLIPFVSVKSLYVSRMLGPFVARALENLMEESVTVLLPALENLFFEGFRPPGFLVSTIESFVSMRQLAGHPVIVRRWERRSAFGSSSGGSPFRSCGHLVFFSDCAPPQLESPYVQCPAPRHRVWPCLHMRRYSTTPTRAYSWVFVQYIAQLITIPKSAFG